METEGEAHFQLSLHSSWICSSSTSCAVQSVIILATHSSLTDVFMDFFFNNYWSFSPLIHTELLIFQLQCGCVVSCIAPEAPRKN